MIPFHHHLRVHPLWAPLAQNIAQSTGRSPEPEENDEDSDDQDDISESYRTDDESPIIE